MEHTPEAAVVGTAAEPPAGPAEGEHVGLTTEQERRRASSGRPRRRSLPGHGGRRRKACCWESPSAGARSCIRLLVVFLLGGLLAVGVLRWSGWAPSGSRAQGGPGAATGPAWAAATSAGDARVPAVSPLAGAAVYPPAQAPASRVPTQWRAPAGIQVPAPGAANPALVRAREISPRSFSDVDWRCPYIKEFCEQVGTFISGTPDISPFVAPQGYVGDRQGLLERLSGVANRGSITVGVMGNSITIGHGCKRPWPGRLQELLRRIPLLRKVNLHKVLKMGGNTASLLLDAGKFSPTVDVVFVDISMGDTLGYRGATRKSLFKQTTKLVSLLRSIATPPPAVVYHELIPYSFYAKSVKGGKAKNHDPCRVNASQFGHMEALRELAVPVVSYFDFLCNALPREGPFVQTQVGETATYWVPGPGHAGPQHPSCDSHEVIAHVLAEFLLQGLRAAAAGPPAAGDVGDLSPKCLLHWATDLRARERAPPYAEVAQAAEQQETANCLGSKVGVKAACNTSVVRVGPAAFPAFVQGRGWVYAEDRAEKPGWIAREGRQGQISFEVSTRLGKVVVEYLRSYTDVGTAVCWVGAGPKRSLEARIGQHVSISTGGVLQAVPVEGLQNVTCITDGKKFKILSVTAC